MSSEMNHGRSARRLPGRVLVRLSILLAVCALRVPSGAQVVYNNFSVANLYDPFTGWIVAGPGTFFDQSIGQKFSPSGSGPLASIEVAMTLFGGPNHFDLFLYGDTAGLPGALLESWSVDGAMSPYDTPGPPVFVASGLAPQLTAGAPYWLVVGTTGDSDTTWHWNLIGDTGPVIGGPNGGPLGNETNDAFGAFRVTVGPSAVPESSSVALLLGGGAGCLLMFRRRRR